MNNIRHEEIIDYEEEDIHIKLSSWKIDNDAIALRIESIIDTIYLECIFSYGGTLRTISKSENLSLDGMNIKNLIEFRNLLEPISRRIKHIECRQ